MAANNILEVVEEYAGSGQTGTVMAVFADNSMGRFYFTAGVLATARYRSKEGDEAVQLALGLEINNLRLHENADLVRSSQFVDPSTLPEFRVARPQTQAAPLARQAPQAPPQMAPQQAPPRAHAGNAGPPLSHVARSSISELLAEYLGPVASVIMADVPPNASADQAIDILSREISDTAMATRFVRDARNILKEF